MQGDSFDFLLRKSIMPVTCSFGSCLEFWLGYHCPDWRLEGNFSVPQISSHFFPHSFQLIIH